MKTKTFNAGASAERDVWLAKIRRLSKPRAGATVKYLDLLIELQDWGLTRKRRFDKRPGGVGRK